MMQSTDQIKAKDAQANFFLYLVLITFSLTMIYSVWCYFLGARLVTLIFAGGSLIFTPVIILLDKYNHPNSARVLLVTSACYYLSISTIGLQEPDYGTLFYIPIFFGTVFVFKSHQRPQLIISIIIMACFLAFEFLAPRKILSTYWVPADFPYATFRFLNSVFSLITQAILILIFDHLFRKATLELTNLQDSLDKYRIVSRTDAAGNIIYVNENFSQVSKFSQQELVGKSHNVINSGFHSKDFFKEMWLTISAGKPWSGHIKNRDKAGNFIWLDSIITPVISGQKITEYFAFRTDITSDKQKALLNTLISDIRGMFIVSNSDKNFFYKHLMNEILVFTESEYGVFCEVNTVGARSPFCNIEHSHISWNDQTKYFYKKRSSRSLTEQQLKNLNTLVSKVLSSKKPVLIDLPLTPQAVLPVFYSGVIMGVICLANRFSGYSLKMIEGLSPLPSLLGEMIHSIRLEEEVAQQSKLILHNAKLASIGQLAAGVGHEINNPLAIIQGLLTIMGKRLKETGADDAEISSKMHQINLAIERVKNIVNGLRGFALVDELQFHNFNLFDLINETVLMTKEVYLQEDVLLEFSNGESEPKSGSRQTMEPHEFIELSEVYGHRGRLQQVLVNLISNARDATAGNPIRKIKVSMSLDRSETNTEAKVIVEDNGQGIPKDLIERIFEPFFTTKPTNTGTGIGLALVSTIMKEHQGKIEVESEVGVGTKMTLTLPTVQGVKSIGATPLQEEQEQQINIRMLIVDDEEALRYILSEVLSNFGITVFAAKNGQEALELAIKENFDLIASDIKMPVMGGIEFLERLREHKEISQPKFIFITGGIEMTQNQIEDLRTKTDGIFTKPYEEKKIFMKIRELFPDKVTTRLH